MAKVDKFPKNNILHYQKVVLFLVRLRIFKKPEILKKILKKSVLTLSAFTVASAIACSSCGVGDFNQTDANNNLVSEIEINDTLEAQIKTDTNQNNAETICPNAAEIKQSGTPLVPETTQTSDVTNVDFTKPIQTQTPTATDVVTEIENPSPTTKLMDAKSITNLVSEYGKITMDGMPSDERDIAMARIWELIKPEGQPEVLEIDIKKPMNFNTLEKYLFNMAKYDGVELLSMGKTVQDRDMYMLKVGFKKPNESKEQFEKRPVIMLSGTVHAREGAGTEYIVKGLNDLIVQAQNDPYLKVLLQNVTFVAVPLVNPDGRETIINGGSATRKSNGCGVDLGRNMPANAGQLAKGYPRAHFESESGLHFFPGEYLGSENETKAMMKWLEVYVPKARCYIDLHQQGNIMYYNKNFLTQSSDNLCKQFANSISKMLNNQYRRISEENDYGLNGAGGTMTDYARSIAEGMVFSYKYGRLVMLVNGEERLLITYKDTDNIIEHYKPLNKNFVAVTPEIGIGLDYLGYGSKALELRSKLYYEDHWDQFFKNVAEYVLGPEKVNEIKNQLEKDQDIIAKLQQTREYLVAKTIDMNALFDSQILNTFDEPSKVLKKKINC